MQTILLFVVVVVIALVALFVLPRDPSAGWRRTMSRLALGVAAGGLAALFSLVPRTDVFPDDLEPTGALLIILGVSVVLGIGSILRLVHED